MDEKVITLNLSEVQRNLLLKYQTEFSDVDLARIVSVALKKNDTYEFHMTEEQLDDLQDELSAIANHKKNRKIRGELDKLCDHIEDYIPDPDDQFRDEYSKYSKNTGNVYVLRVALE